MLPIEKELLGIVFLLMLELILILSLFFVGDTLLNNYGCRIAETIGHSGVGREMIVEQQVICNESLFNKRIMFVGIISVCVLIETFLFYVLWKDLGEKTNGKT